ncbi:hypothetical protein OS125_11460 [Corynebacterium sp. P7003]|uniref:Uncharacterized protein n=1 Tax=Corynebacterium pygosceleis TaxID=2800406 RepID=A0ABT3WYD3_9CORY|nr:hypothetical protein [Corynebacterium pygosceleis]MCX7445848.1 hypothetical protein [Corynebacterium pygosceleis]
MSNQHIAHLPVDLNEWRERTEKSYRRAFICGLICHAATIASFITFSLVDPEAIRSIAAGCTVLAAYGAGRFAQFVYIAQDSLSFQDGIARRYVVGGDGD